jgi:Flp pilus assembly protein TadB
VISGLVATFAGSAWARGALRYGLIACAILLSLLARRRSCERADRHAEQLETMERTLEAQQPMLEAAARRPRSRNDLAERRRDGRLRGGLAWSLSAYRRVQPGILGAGG